MSVKVWLQLAVSDGVPQRALKVMMIVGPVLTVINQGDRILATGEFSWPKLILTFIVPYVVATIGSVGARLHEAPARPEGDRSVPCQASGASLGSRAPQDSDSGGGALQARVQVTLKAGVLDPQGKAIENALASLGFAGVRSVRQGKVIELDLEEKDPQRARRDLEAMCEKLLANTVIENYDIEIRD